MQFRLLPGRLSAIGTLFHGAILAGPGEAAKVRDAACSARADGSTGFGTDASRSTGATPAGTAMFATGLRTSTTVDPDRMRIAARW